MNEVMIISEIVVKNVRKKPLMVIFLATLDQTMTNIPRKTAVWGLDIKER
jgi:hypothetical protein